MSTLTANLPTAVHDLHLQLQGRMVSFAGYQLPVQYPLGLVAEHRHTREAAGWFDISHMGQFEIAGPQAAQALARVLPIDTLGLRVGQQKYALLLQADGGILDDLMVFRRASGFWLVVNGACKHQDWAHLSQHLTQPGVTLTHRVDRSLFALQGPQSAAVLARLVPGVEALVFMTGGEWPWQGADLIITRSGYTGEDGFEISVPNDHALALARALLAQPEVQAVGLGARNSLRLEAGLPLYGQDLNPSFTPLAAQLQWSIPKVRRTGGEHAGGFIGAERVLAELSGQLAPARVRVTMQAQERVPVREPAALEDAHGQVIGQITSGLLSPSRDVAIAMAWVDAGFAATPGPCWAIVRQRRVPMQIVPSPFVPHRYHRG